MKMLSEYEMEQKKALRNKISWRVDDIEIYEKYYDEFNFFIKKFGTPEAILEEIENMKKEIKDLNFEIDLLYLNDFEAKAKRLNNE